jgi:energy-coupling factor transport system permease protein
MSASSFTLLAQDSPFARVDVRAKLTLVACVTAVTLIWDRPSYQLGLAFAVFLLCAIGRVGGSYLMSLFRIMIPFYIILLITHGFFNTEYVRKLTGQASLTTLWQVPAGVPLLAGIRLTSEGTLFGLNASLKTVVLTLLAPLLIFTTSVDGLIAGLVRARVPYKLAFILSATLRFFPMLMTDARSIIDAQRMRGLAVERMSLPGRIRVYARLAVPLILGAMTKSQQLEVVLQAKAFSGSHDRTYLHDAKLRASDYVIMACSVLLLLTAAGLYLRFGWGRFTGAL